jgi:hypothetical protein
MVPQFLGSPRTVALSSTEAEYVAEYVAAAELIWMKRLLQEMGVIFSGPVTTNEDNQSCIHLLDMWEYRCLKHVDVKT